MDRQIASPRSTLDALKRAVANAWSNDVPTVLEVSVSGEVPPLV
jgi:hypothetical protein